MFPFRSLNGRSCTQTLRANNRFLATFLRRLKRQLLRLHLCVCLLQGSVVAATLQPAKVESVTSHIEAFESFEVLPSFGRDNTAYNVR